MKKELSCKTRFLIYRSIFVPTLTFGHELWVETERTRLRQGTKQEAEMGFHREMAGLRDRVRNLVTREKLGVEPLILHIERGGCSGGLDTFSTCPLDLSWERYSKFIHVGGQTETCWRN